MEPDTSPTGDPGDLSSPLPFTFASSSSPSPREELGGKNIRKTTPRIIIPRKRNPEIENLRPFQPRIFQTDSLMLLPPLPTTSRKPTTSQEAISLARDLVVQASQLATSKMQQDKLLDLLEVFRDYTENNRLNKQSLTIMAS